jgi:hypothetical protein
MSSPTRTRRLVWLKTSILAPLLFLSAAAPASSLDWQSRLSPRLLALWTQQQQAAPGEKIQPRGAPPPARTMLSPARFDQDGRVQLDVHYNCSAAVPTKTLAAAGLLIGATVHVPPLCTVEGWLQTSGLPELAAHSAVHSIDLPTYSTIIRPVMRSFDRTQAAVSTVIDGSAVSIMHADQYIQTTGINGTGVTIGVMSDDVTSLAIIQSRGELPAHISNLTPAQQSPNPNPSDEGTMLLEEMHAVAPGARLAFCAPQTDVEYVSCLHDLIAVGATVVADDIEFPGEDAMSAQSTLAQSVQSLLVQNANVLLFSAAGNENESFWQGAYEPTQLSRPLTCSANGQPDAYAQAYGTSLDETLTLFDTLRAPIYLQWADPFGQNRSNFDLYVLNSNHHVLECIPGAGSRNVSVIDSNPQLPKGRYYLIIATPDTEFAGKFLKLLVYGNGAARFSAPTPGAIASPQKLLSRVVTVGAVYGGDGVGSNIEVYSSTGPVQLQFPTPTSLQAPVLVAPDGIYIDANGTKFLTGSDALFYGTSASTPNVAAVGALLRATFPTLSAQRIISALTNGAVPLGVSAPNGVFGYGRVDAVGALQTLARPTISRIANITVVGGTSSSAVVTLGGTGKLTLSGTSDNSALVSFAASTGAQFAPATCGSSTNSCTLIITPVLGQVGTAHLVISAADGAGRSTSTSLTVTVTEPPPPTVSVTSGGNQSLQSGNAASLITLSLSGTKQLTISVTSSNAALLPASSATLSSGCGTSSLTCTVSLWPIAGQSGQTTLTVTAHDPYGQSAQSTLSVSITAAGKSGGGGAFDCCTLIILGMLLAGQRVVQSQSRRLIRRSAETCAKR